MSRLFLLGLTSPLLIPPVIFAGCALAAGLSPADTWNALLEQYAADRQNLFVVGLLGFFPVLLLLIALWLHRRSGRSAENRLALAWGGLAPTLLVLVWVNLQFWPTFLPDRVYPGFPHGLEFLIGPVFFAPGAMIAGMLFTWWVRRSPKTRASSG